jgi:hypothetical protein
MAKEKITSIVDIKSLKAETKSVIRMLKKVNKAIKNLGKK